jgi:hypothetical protein
LFLPLFGISLAAFVVVDLLVGLRGLRKVREPEPESEVLLV